MSNDETKGKLIDMTKEVVSIYPPFFISAKNMLLLSISQNITD